MGPKIGNLHPMIIRYKQFMDLKPPLNPLSALNSSRWCQFKP